jgi:hypothetical protein
VCRTRKLGDQRLATHTGCRTLAEPDNRDYQSVRRSLAAALKRRTKRLTALSRNRTGRTRGEATRTPGVFRGTEISNPAPSGAESAANSTKGLDNVGRLGPPEPRQGPCWSCW